MDDPDASGGAYVHWVIAGIDATVNEIVEDARLDRTVEGLTTGKKAGYAPPCPPKEKSIGTGSPSTHWTIRHRSRTAPN